MGVINKKSLSTNVLRLLILLSDGRETSDMVVVPSEHDSASDSDVNILCTCTLITVCKKGIFVGKQNG